MSWDPVRSPTELESALLRFEFAQIELLVQELIAYVFGGGAIDQEDAHRVLTGLRRKRQFVRMSAVADALIQSGHDSLQIRQVYAQALLDLGLLSAAQAVLDALIRDSEQAAAATRSAAQGRAENVLVEARGLVGRLHKQAYVNAGEPSVARNAQTLKRAIDAYYLTYLEHSGDRERRWHAVNAVALGLRARNDTPGVKLDFDPEQVAREVIAAVQADHRAGTARFWDYACAMEASLAIDDEPAALHFVQEYIAETSLDAFGVASTQRQLAEVWSFRPPNSLRDKLLALLQARLRGLEGGRVTTDAGEGGMDARRGATLHHAFQPSFERAHVYARGLERALSVARVERDALIGVGTGVIVRGGDLYAPLGDERLLLTNAHVAAKSSVPWAHAVDAAQARVAFLFGRTPNQEPFRTTVRDVVWQSSPALLDACLLRLQELPGHFVPCPIAAPAPVPELVQQRVYLAGYPRGESLQFSFIDNVTIDADETVLYYCAETDDGSSGSPVFDPYFRLVALHHEGCRTRSLLSHIGTRDACAGVRISAIAAALAADLGGR